MPIYTRTGDTGKTSLFGGKRIYKSDLRVETYGTVDELNSVIGQARSLLPKSKVKVIHKELENIQHDLLAIGSSLATPNAKPLVPLESRPKEFEKLIDTLTAKLPELKQFILPSGSKAGSTLHVCRSITRRVERKVVLLMQQEGIDTHILVYLNRLSDLFFTMARYVNQQENQPETKWKKIKSQKIEI